MQTLSSAKRTCMASSSAVECTATVAMPSSLQARSTRSAISPRLAISIFSNITSRSSDQLGARRGRGKARSFPTRLAIRHSPSFDDHQRLAILDRVAVLDQDLYYGARARRRNLVHRLHCFDDEKSLAGFDFAAHIDKGPCSRLRRAIS